MGRTVVRIRGQANEALLELSRRVKLNPVQIIERSLLRELNAMKDEALFEKKLFKHSIVFRLELPFCFPYEFEEFEFQINNAATRLYLERVPKRQVIDMLPFRTMVTSVIELAPEEVRFAKENTPNVTVDKLKVKYLVPAHYMVKNIIISFRRVTNDYYNLGIIEPPINLEEFEQKVQMSIILDSQAYSSSRFMPVKEGSFISVKQPLNEKLRSEMMTFVFNKLHDKGTDFLTNSNEYLDAAVVFYYQELWNLCLLDSVIAMESGIAGLVFASALTKYYLSKRSGGADALRKIYKDKGGLPKKIESFLFPIADTLKLHDVSSDLRRLMPFIHNVRTNDGIYDLRSKIVHEGLAVGREEAEQAKDLSLRFLEILRSINAKAT